MKPVDEMLKKKQYREIWEQYCGFLDLDLPGYMKIQNRLLLEQIGLWADSQLGRSILKGKQPKTVEEFRRMVPLTTYEDYADVLLLKRDDMLPEKPLIWIQTTWEGGRHPVKLAPYTRGMLDTFRDNVVACELLCTSRAKGQFKTRPHDKILYGLAPLPYATGL
ncbi:MAG: GH3 auxin-responsive promoter family protein, partial [Neglectibacter sp.]